MKHTLLAAVLLLLVVKPATAQQVIQLYPGKAPGSESWTWSEQTSNNNPFRTEVVYNVSQPTLTAYLPPRDIATGTAVIVAPGGAFHTLNIHSEGSDVAKWLNSKGVAAFVLKYRLARSFTDDPVSEIIGKMADFKALDAENEPIIPLAMADGLRAVGYVREHAAELDIDPQKIGFMGFSAGGTLTMSVVYNATEADRPNFVAPIYAYGNAIIGSTVPPAPTPIFVAVAGDDQLGFMPHSIDIYRKWHEAGQPAELHVFEKGGHGFGMRKTGLPSEKWHERFGDWLKMHGFLKKRYPSDWEQQYTEEQIQEFIRASEERQKNDWAFRSRYAAENKKLPAPKAGETRVVFLGNSITEGWVSAQAAFFTGNHFVGRGISGQTSPQTLLRFRQDVLDLKPRAVVINIGTNDVAENTGPYDPDFTLGNIISMAELAKANGVKVVLASVLPASEFPWRKEISGVADKILALNARIKAYAREHNIVYLDYHSAMKNDRNGLSPDLAGDGVHPTLKGYQIMAALAKEAVNKALKSR